jgi:hypothetical protein
VDESLVFVKKKSMYPKKNKGQGCKKHTKRCNTNLKWEKNDRKTVKMSLEFVRTHRQP